MFCPRRSSLGDYRVLVENGAVDRSYRAWGGFWWKTERLQTAPTVLGVGFGGKRSGCKPLLPCLGWVLVENGVVANRSYRAWGGFWWESEWLQTAPTVLGVGFGGKRSGCKPLLPCLGWVLVGIGVVANRSYRAWGGFWWKTEWLQTAPTVLGVGFGGNLQTAPAVLGVGFGGNRSGCKPLLPCLGWVLVENGAVANRSYRGRGQG